VDCSTSFSNSASLTAVTNCPAISDSSRYCAAGT